MNRLSPVQGTVLFFFLAPVTVAGIVPWLITGWRFQDAFLGIDALRFAGVALIVAGLDVVVDSFARFAVLGRGTPAPAYPTGRLVMSGAYRHVRNPMYVAVLSAIAGQALLFAND
jgi:protein-S-isoprenylcysteine O-methyltransferase Ste14